MYGRLLELNSSTKKSKDTVEASRPVWMAHWIGINSAEISINGITENRTGTETVNATLPLSSNSVENDRSGWNQCCLQGNSSMLSSNNGYGVARSSDGSIKYPHWIPDSVIKLSSTGGHGYSEDALPVSHPEFLKDKASSDAALGLEKCKEDATAFHTELVDLKMKGLMQEDSTSANLMSETEEASFSLSGSSGLMKFNKSLSLESPFTDLSRSICGQETFKKTQNFHHPTLLPSQLRSFEMGNTVDSAESYSQTTHSLFMTTKSDDVNLSKPNAAHTSKLIEVGGKKSRRIQTLPPLSPQGNTGFKRKKLSSHSSAKVGTLKLGLLNNEKFNSGISANFTTLHQGSKDAIGSTQEIEMKLYGEDDVPVKKARSLDINTGPPALFIAGCSSENKCQSSQETQIMESNLTDTWVYRLKQTSSTSSNQSSKPLKPSEDSCHDKVSMFSSSDRRRHCKEPIVNDRIHGMPKEDVKNCEELLLSHSWIKRLLKDGCGSPNRTIASCEPQCLKLGADESPKKQFPSIAAMALVGRTMNGARSYET